MALLSALMGIVNLAALIWVMFHDKTGLNFVYFSSLLFFVGMQITKQLEKDKK